MTITSRISPPEGYTRQPSATGSFGNWLRGLPLKAEGAGVYLYDGRKKPRQDVHAAVIDMDIGAKNLQQCADAVIRLRAEYWYAQNEYDRMSFNFTSGDTASFRKWIMGHRPSVNGSRVRWDKVAPIDSSYQVFRSYLETVFMYAGSYSLSKQLRAVAEPHGIEIGDVFIEGGFPGHAVMVVDMAVHEESGKKVMLLAQSYMPAQDVHVLVNPKDSLLSPWYACDFGETLVTPEWTFGWNHLMRF